MPLGLRGPDTERRSDELLSRPSANETLSGWSQIGVPNRRSRLSGLLLAAGKWAARAADPAAESLVAGAPLMNPPVVKPNRPVASAANKTSPASSTTSGLLTTRAAMRPQAPVIARPVARWLGQNNARPQIAISAGSRVSAATSITATPSASDGPRPRYRAKDARTRQARAAITVVAE